MLDSAFVGHVHFPVCSWDCISYLHPPQPFAKDSAGQNQRHVRYVLKGLFVRTHIKFQLRIDESSQLEMEECQLGQFQSRHYRR
jgi:hypothetical protein